MKFIITAAVFATVALAQVDQARITGTVVDSSGALIPGAAIKVKNQKTGAEREAIANDSAAFFITGLSPSVYSMTVSSPGLSNAQYKDLNLAVGQEQGAGPGHRLVPCAGDVTGDFTDAGDFGGA